MKFEYNICPFCNEQLTDSYSSKYTPKLECKKVKVEVGFQDKSHYTIINYLNIEGKIHVQNRIIYDSKCHLEINSHYSETSDYSRVYLIKYDIYSGYDLKLLFTINNTSDLSPISLIEKARNLLVFS